MKYFIKITSNDSRVCYRGVSYTENADVNDKNMRPYNSLIAARKDRNHLENSVNEFKNQIIKNPKSYPKDYTEQNIYGIRLLDIASIEIEEFELKGVKVYSK
jgi:hypothetical protein